MPCGGWGTALAVRRKSGPGAGWGLRAKLLTSYLAVIALAATTMIVIAEWTAPLFYHGHIEEMVQMFGITDIPEMRRQLSQGFTGAFGSALAVATTVTSTLR